MHLFKTFVRRLRLRWPFCLSKAKAVDKSCQEEPLVEDAGVELLEFKIRSDGYHHWLLSVEESKVWSDLDVVSSDLSFWEQRPSNYGCVTEQPICENVIAEIDGSDEDPAWMIYIEELLEY